MTFEPPEFFNDASLNMYIRTQDSFEYAGEPDSEKKIREVKILLTIFRHFHPDETPCDFVARFKRKISSCAENFGTIEYQNPRPNVTETSSWSDVLNYMSTYNAESLTIYGR